MNDCTSKLDDLNEVSVLVTRPKHQAGALCQWIANLKGKPVRFPTLDIIPYEEALKVELNSLSLVVWTSPNAVGFCPRAMIQYFESHASILHIPMGSGTHVALLSKGLPSNFIPDDGTTSESLIPQIMKHCHLRGGHCLVVKGVGGRNRLASLLQEQGANANTFSVYQRVLPEQLNAKQKIENWLDAKQSVALATSSQSLVNLFSLIPSSFHHNLLRKPCIVVSERTKIEAEQQGFRTVWLADSASDSDLIQCLLNHV